MSHLTDILPSLVITRSFHVQNQNKQKTKTSPSCHPPPPCANTDTRLLLTFVITFHDTFPEQFDTPFVVLFKTHPTPSTPTLAPRVTYPPDRSRVQTRHRLSTTRLRCCRPQQRIPRDIISQVTHELKLDTGPCKTVRDTYVTVTATSTTPLRAPTPSDNLLRVRPRPKENLQSTSHSFKCSEGNTITNGKE
jgi:hypothetical protein